MRSAFVYSIYLVPYLAQIPSKIDAEQNIIRPRVIIDLRDEHSVVDRLLQDAS